MPKREELHLRLAGAGVLIRSESASLLGPLRAYFGSPENVEADYAAEIDLYDKKILSPIPTHSKLALRYFGLKVFFHEGRTYFTDFRSYLTLEPGGGKAAGYISPETLAEGGLHFFTHIFITLALFEMLRHQGVFFLHSAGLVSPEGRSVVFPASSGQGKTTLALYLIRNGYHYLSDDTVFLRRSSGKVQIHGFPKVSHIPEEIFGRLPELAPFKDAPWLDQCKKIVDLDKVYPGQRTRGNAAPGAIIFLKRTSRDQSELKPMDKLEAFPLLMCQSPFAHINPDLARSHLDIFRDFVAASRVWSLESGTDWIVEPSMLKTIIEAALNGRRK